MDSKTDHGITDISNEFVLMQVLFAFWLGLALALIPFVRTASAEEMSIEDLLIPEVSSMKDKIENQQNLAQVPKEEINIDDLLGPADFPFLPDNHRDSGTGKFNRF